MAKLFDGDRDADLDPFTRYTEGGGYPPTRITRADLIAAGYVPGTASFAAAVEMYRHFGSWADDGDGTGE
jgi:hypothetical protein